MSNFLLTIYAIFYILLIFIGSKPAPKGEFVEEPWNRHQSLMIQAIACIGVVLHHVTQEVTGYGVMDKGPVTIFNSIGILFTSLFFFFSGYGLVISVRTKEVYLKTFLWKRMPVILLPFWIANIISVLVHIFYLQLPMKSSDLIKYVLGLVLMNGNGWFIVEIFFLYLAFYLMFKTFKNQKVALVLLSIASLIPIVIGLRSGHDTSAVGNHWFKGEWWYNSTIVFVMGLWVAHFKDQILTFAKKHYRGVLITSAILLVVAYAIEEYVRMVFGYYSVTPIHQRISNEMITLYAQMVLCLVFTWVVLLLNLKIAFGNHLLQGISKISMEIFLLHGIFLQKIFDTSKMSEEMLYIAVLLCGVFSAMLVHILNQFLIRCIHRCVEKKGQKRSEYERAIQKAELARRRRNFILLVLLSGIVIGIGGFIYSSWIRPASECEKEVEKLSGAQVGDVVPFGRYDTDPVHIGTERLQWIVLQKEDDTLMLITQEGIAGSVYHQRHTEVNWNGSDLCAFLNDTLYDDMFSKYEQEMILDNPATGDQLSLLSETEVSRLFSDDKSRQLNITEAAKSKGTNVNNASKTNHWDVKGYRSSWWWLRGEEASKTAPIVTEDGVVLSNEKFVNKPNGAVRPVVWISIHMEEGEVYKSQIFYLLDEDAIKEYETVSGKKLPKDQYPKKTDYRWDMMEMFVCKEARQ